VPGSAIEEHSYATRPGLVQTLPASWTEVLDGKEASYSDTDKKEALVADESTTHWLNNDGDVLGVAVVFGLSQVTQLLSFKVTLVWQSTAPMDSNRPTWRK
jgi:hypothetical protein